MWNVLLSIFCNIGLVGMNCFGLSLSWKIFISPSKLKDSFAGYGILRWEIFSLRAWIIFQHVFLTFRVCAERAEVILVCLPL
jgi:hypothetical protein